MGRNQKRLQAVSDDLQVRNPNAKIDIKICDFIDPKAITTLTNSIAKNGLPDLVLIAHGLLPDQTQCQHDLSACQHALAINGISPALFAEAFAQKMAKQNHGKIAVIGSIAGDRGKASNYIYGAAKGLVERYIEGLQHRFAQTHLQIILLKPGPTDTPMTAHFKQKGRPLASVESVATQIVTAIEKNKSVAYMPRKWQCIMWVIQHLPRFIFHQLKI